MGGGGLRATYLLPSCCICDTLSFDMQHGHVLKKLDFDLLTPPTGSGGGGGGSAAKFVLPCCYIHDSL